MRTHEGLTKHERAAIDAVARRFSATWEQGSDPPDAYLVVAGKRVAVEITTLRRRGTGQTNGAKPRLRFDKVATRLIERLQATLGDTVPDGTTVLLTITAPIRVPAKTAASLEARIQTLVGRRSPGRDEKATIHGNRIRIQLVRDESERAPKMIGFVHNADSDPVLLLNMTRECLASKRRGWQARAKACGRSMARRDQRQRKFMPGGVSLHLFAVAHAGRLQEDSHGVW